MFGITRGMTLPFLFLAFAAWAVFLGGLASLQNECVDDTTNQYGVAQRGESTAFSNVQGNARNTGGLMNVWGFSAGPVPCARLYRFYWFMMAFELLVIIGAAITAATRLGLHYSRPFWVGMFSIATLLFMIASEAFLAGLDSDFYNAGMPLYRMRTAAAGAIMLVVANILCLMAIGSDWEGRQGKGIGGTEHATTPTRVVASEPVGVARV